MIHERGDLIERAKSKLTIFASFLATIQNDFFFCCCCGCWEYVDNFYCRNLQIYQTCVECDQVYQARTYRIDYVQTSLEFSLLSSSRLPTYVIIFC
ncbi:unnamed protein product [Chironomus riparius]|uniref:Uncharacterized protein n=1 Tax=Chironomus riparius TaxID=315576 RepID=A0A9N9RZX3_9DIPT|nr:unnamed protein product [Chironomus riparius]